MAELVCVCVGTLHAIPLCSADSVNNFFYQRLENGTFVSLSLCWSVLGGVSGGEGRG